MKGRFYDPQIGQMLSPDPLISEIENAQTYNKYSYVFNNPFKYTDPTGYYGALGPGDISLEEERELREREQRELAEFEKSQREEGINIGKEIVIDGNEGENLEIDFELESILNAMRNLAEITAVLTIPVIQVAADLSKISSSALPFIGFFLSSGVSLMDYTSGKNSTGKTVSDLSLGTWGLALSSFGFAIPATAAGTLYLGVDKLYPGGFGEAMDKRTSLEQQNREVLGNSFNLSR